VHILFQIEHTHIYIYIYIYIYVWKLNQTVLELDFRAVKFLFFPRTIITWYSIPPNGMAVAQWRQLRQVPHFQNIRTDLAFARLCSSDSHFKLGIIDVTAPGSRSWKLFETNRAALRCTESSWDIWFLPSSPGTAYHQMYVRPVLSASSRQG
jgi:hypothetical protein